MKMLPDTDGMPNGKKNNLKSETSFFLLLSFIQPEICSQPQHN